MHPFFKKFLSYSNYNLAVAVGFGFILNIAAQALQNSLINTISTSIFIIAGNLLLLKNGSILHSRYFRFINILLSILFVGILLKILHINGGDILLIISMTAIPVVYFLWFVSKSVKAMFDILKVLFVLSYFFVSLSLIEHWPLYSVLKIMPTAIFMLLLVTYCYTYRKTLFSEK